MNDQRTSCGAKDKRSLVQRIHNGFVFRQQLPFLWEKTGPQCLVLVGLTAGWQADETQLDYEIFKIPYRLNYLDFYFVDISSVLLIVLEVHFSLLFSNKMYFLCGA